MARDQRPRGHRVARHPRRALRQAGATARAAERADRTPADQLALLDRRAVRAERERSRLTKQIEAEQKGAA